ncbi:DUF5988 family protein [Herbidospora sp. RD11066]
MAGNDIPNVFLRGGSTSVLAEDDRLRYLPDLTVTTLKILCGNRYEHFEASADTTLVDDRELRVFEWARHTYVAE